jgi:hypothetical protein
MAKSGINIICNGNIWTSKQAETARSSGVYGVRLHHLPSIELFVKNHKE